MATKPSRKKESTCSSGAPRVKASRSPEVGEVSMIPEGTSPLSFCESLKPSNRDGSSGKTSLAFCLPQKDGTLVPSSGTYKNAGTGSPTECLTLSTSECPSDVVESSLSDILETGDLPQQYYLTDKTATGILRRAASGKRSGKLPPYLEKALKALKAGE